MQLSLFDKEEIPLIQQGKRRRPWIDFTPPSADTIVQKLSYGAGKQTFAMLVLIEQGKLPKPDLIIMADTGREIPETYHHLNTVAIPLIERLGIPFHIVKRDENEDIYQYHMRHQLTPIWPTCTSEFKLYPMARKIRTLYEIKNGVHSIDSWIGITTDEAHRATPTYVAYERKVFPLLDLGLSRQDCINLTLSAGYPVPPKSGCDICPHKDWELLYTQNPEMFQSALELEQNAALKPGKEKVRLPEYGRGLRQIILQPKFGYNGSELFNDACSTGYCGV